MNILHIANLRNNLYNGVCVVVPQYVSSQSKFAKTALLNINAIHYSNDLNINYITYKHPFDLNNLPVPFNKPDLVVFNEAYCFTYLSIAKELRKSKIPYIIIPHGELQKQALHHRWLKKKIANFLFWNKFFKGSIALQCLSQNEFINTNIKGYKFIATNGVSTKDLTKKSFNQNKIKFIYIGRLDINHKGLDILIKAISLTKELLIQKNCSFNLYGPDYQGRYRQVQNLISENHVEEIVTLHHEVYGMDKERLLLESDIFIQTSRFEGMPLGIIEAMSYGLPCLITEGTTLGPYIQRTNSGWVAATTPDSVSKQLTHVIEDQKILKDKGHNAVKCILNNFTWEEIAKKTVSEYVSILDTRQQ